MKKTYIAPAIKEERMFADDILVVIGSGGSAADNGIIEAEARERAAIEQMNAEASNGYSLW